VDEACESAGARRVAKQFELAATTVWSIDLPKAGMDDYLSKPIPPVKQNLVVQPTTRPETRIACRSGMWSRHLGHVPRERFHRHRLPSFQTPFGFPHNRWVMGP
jgi:hypothetical protein